MLETATPDHAREKIRNVFLFLAPDEEGREVTTPKTGRTALAHVEQLLDQSAAVIAKARQQVTTKQRPAERIHLWRELAGVIADCETVRLWLDMGAPR